MRRFGCFVVLALLMVVAVVLAMAWLISSLIGHPLPSAIGPAIFVLLLLIFVPRIVRGFRGTAAPLGDLIEASSRVEAGEVGAQVEVRGPREIRALGRAFNAMSSRLAADTEARKRLLADVSHELRTPLTVIQGSVEAMLDGVYPADRPHLERLLAETRQLERLVEDLRTLSLADAGALPLHRQPLDLADMSSDVVSGFQPQADAAGVAIGVDAADVPVVEADERRIRQVVANLMSNALRHTPSGGSVTVRLRAEAAAVILEVVDTGSGMDADAAAHAFDRFWRAGDAAGAGIGLSIVRDLVEAHGGDVALVSAPGAGTTVRCRFPAHAP
jgi:two-component system sensor histidine kinase BaeS